MDRDYVCKLQRAADKTRISIAGSIEHDNIGYSDIYWYARQLPYTLCLKNAPTL